MHSAAAPLLLIAVVLSFAALPACHTAAVKVVGPWSQCGGRWGNAAYQGQDIAWSDTACMDGSGCVRGSADYWQCRPGETATAPAPIPPTAAPTPLQGRVVGEWSQCGGRWGNAAFQGLDAVWPDTSCKTNAGCVRLNPDYWQCRPGEQATQPIVPTAAPTAAPTTAPTVAPGNDAPTDAPATDAPADDPATSAPTETPATNAPTDTSSTDAPTDDSATDAPTDDTATTAPTDAPTTDEPTDAPATDAPTAAPATNAPTAAPLRVAGQYVQCGGKWGNAAYQGQDVAWADTVCTTGTGCVRGSADYWQCRPGEQPTIPATSAPIAPTPDVPTPAPMPPTTVNLWNQCGGKWGNPTYQGQDVQWGNTACIEGSECTRLSADYWQCRPKVVPTAAPLPSPPPPSGGMPSYGSRNMGRLFVVAPAHPPPAR